MILRPSRSTLFPYTTLFRSLALPSIQKQANDLIVDIPKYVEQIGGDIQNITDDSFLESTYDKGYEWVQSTLSDVPNAIKNYTGDVYEGFVNVATTVTNVFVALFTFPFVLFFLLKDGDAFKRFFLRILPPKFRSDADQILHNMDQQVGSYIRGQIIVAICIGILLYIGYLII